MASYRYLRDIDPEELKPDAPKPLTPAQKRANFWDYYFKYVVLGVVIVAVALFLTFCGGSHEPKADYGVAVVSPYTLSGTVTTALSDALSAYGQDLNGDGIVHVAVNSYVCSYASTDTAGSESDAASTSDVDSLVFSDISDMYAAMAGQVQLSADLEACTSTIFLLYDPKGFENYTGSLAYPDGSLPVLEQLDVTTLENSAGNYISDWYNMVYHWDDCPVLASLDLGELSEGVPLAPHMKSFYVGTRGGWTDKAAEEVAKKSDLWAALSAGAVSTVTETELDG